jgi:hypothetical protein
MALQDTPKSYSFPGAALDSITSVKDLGSLHQRVIFENKDLSVVLGMPRATQC